MQPDYHVESTCQWQERIAAVVENTIELGKDERSKAINLPTWWRLEGCLSIFGVSLVWYENRWLNRENDNHRGLRTSDITLRYTHKMIFEENKWCKIVIIYPAWVSYFPFELF